MKKEEYCPPEAEIILVRTEERFMTLYNDPFEEDDDDIFGDGND